MVEFFHHCCYCLSELTLFGIVALLLTAIVHLIVHHCHCPCHWLCLTIIVFLLSLSLLLIIDIVLNTFIVVVIEHCDFGLVHHCGV